VLTSGHSLTLSQWLFTEFTVMGIAERRQREKEERREQILDAAETVFFGPGGVDAATMEDIAQAAELSKGALYLYFNSKDELLTAVINRTHETFLRKLEQAAVGPGRGLTLVASIMRSYLRLVEDFPGHARLMVSSLATGRCLPVDVPNYGQHRELVIREIELVMGVIERGKRDGSIRGNVEPMQVTVQLWGGLMGMLMLVLNREQMNLEVPGAPDVDAVVHSYVELFLRGIAADTADVERLSGVA